MKEELLNCMLLAVWGKSAEFWHRIPWVMVILATPSLLSQTEHSSCCCPEAAQVYMLLAHILQ